MLQRSRAVMHSLILWAAIAACTAGMAVTAMGDVKEDRGEDSAQKTVRVAYPIQKRITDIDEYGSYCGYTYEYLQEIAQYTGWRYEFVQVPGTEDEQILKLTEMVKSGEVDLMGAMMYSKELDADFDYSAYGYGTVETVLKTLTDSSSRAAAIDASQSQTMRIAVMSKTGRQIDDLMDYCEMNLIRPELVLCDSEPEMVKALKDGRADVLLSSSMNYSDELRVIARFSPRQFYFVVSPARSSDLLAEMNEAMDNINLTDPYFQTSLYETYFTPNMYGLALSAREVEYIRQAGPLRIGVMNNWPPFEYRDPVDQSLKGIGVELLRHISRKTGLKLELVEADSQEQLYDMASGGDIDLIAGMPYDYTVAAEHRLSMTRPYVTSQYALILNESISEDHIKGKRLALSKSSTYKGYFVGKVVRFDSIDECIRAVRDGEADYTYANVHTAQYYINLPEFQRLKMVPQTFTPSEICFGIPAPADHDLFNILNKAILSMPVEEIQSIIYVNSLPKQELSIKMYIRRNPVEAILIVTGVCAVVIFMMSVILRQHYKAGKVMALELQKHQRLHAVSNDFIFEYDYKKKDLMYITPENETGTQQITHYNLEENDMEGDDKRSCDKMREFLELQEGRIFEERLFAPDRRWHWFRIVLEIIHDDEGRPVYAIGRLNMIDEERSERLRLLEKAQRDSLTHLYNVESSRGMIEESLANQGGGETGALILLDIDCFKRINDTYGHLRGDEVLKEVARFLQKNFREGDIIGRQGGDEFLAYMTDIKSGETLREKCAALCRLAHGVELDSDHCLTVSVGACLTCPGQDYTHLYKAADMALYKAKDAGRDGFYILDNPTVLC